MRTIEPQDLKNILERHRKWMIGESGGECANLSSADLRYADLSSANLSYANLSYADLRSANLRYANLSYADLRSANLRYANLSSANLSSANLRSADLRSADLRSADLRSADLRYADLSSANLSSANLSYADLRDIIEDFYKILSAAKNEVQELYKFVWDGKIKGSAYQGECACLVGSIANIKKVNHKMIEGITPDADRLAEKWFLGINEGDMPQNSQISKLTAEWMEEFMKKEGIEIPKRNIVWS